MIERASEFGAAEAASAAVPLTSSSESEDLTAGDMLRQAREAHGLDIAVVAAALKVPPQKIEALEDDDIDALPDPVFARALAASMSRALRMDPAPVLARLPGAPRRGFGPTQRPLGTSFNTDVQRGNGSPLSRTLWTVVALLLVGAGAVVFVPQSVFDRIGAYIPGMKSNADATSAQTTDGTAAPAAGLASSAPAGQTIESVTPAAAPVAPAAPANPASTATSTVPTAGTLQGASTTPAAAAPGAAADAAKSDTSNDLVAFTAREDAWISVTDGAGKQLLRRLVKAGETVPVNGTAPLAVVVGRASAVDVTVRGKPFDIKAGAGSGGVARFEVKP